MTPGDVRNRVAISDASAAAVRALAANSSEKWPAKSRCAVATHDAREPD